MNQSSLTVRCQCSRVQGVIRHVRPSTVSRAVCYCAYCQGYAQHLGQADALDSLGGTEVINVSPRHLSITTGEEHIGCLCLTHRGALRFYATCCNTPLFNTFRSRSMPFIGVNTCCVVDLGDDIKRDARLGKVRGRVFGDKLTYQHLPKSSRWAVNFMLFRLSLLTAFWWLRGDAKHSPVFNKSGQPIATPVMVKLKDIKRVSSG